MVIVSVYSQIESMLPAAYEAYECNTDIINGNRRRGYRILLASQKTFTDGAMDALDEPTLDYMAAVKDEAKGKTLWIPKPSANAALSVKEIITLAERNAKAQGMTLLRRRKRHAFLSEFTSHELSGDKPGSSKLVVHTFAPSTLTPRLYGPVQYQRNVYEQLRAENPGVNVHAPALAQSVGGWAIHTSGVELPLSATAETTFDRSVEVEPRWLFNIYDYPEFAVPCSALRRTTLVGASWAKDNENGRAWVGAPSDIAA